MKPACKRLLPLLLLALFSVTQFCFSDPAVVYYDPGMTHAVTGLNRYPSGKKDWTFNFNFSPFFQHASGARDKDGNKVPIGDRLGRWEILGIFWDDNGTDSNPFPAAPADNPVNDANYHYLYTLSHDLVKHGVRQSGDEGPTDATADYSVDIEYEKIGVRSELDFEMAGGFGLTVKGGLVEYKQTPTFTDKSIATDDEMFDMFLTRSLMSHEVGRQGLIETDLGLSLARYETMVFEDTHAELYWSNPYKLDDEHGNHTVTVAPYLSAGLWIPTGKKKNQNAAFSLPSGHDGFWGLSFKGAINFDFPGTVLVNIGGGATFFETKTLSGQRVPNHESQRSIYPWKARIRKTYGPGINFNFSLRSENIMDYLSVYFDYIYAKHEKDTITMKETDSSRNSYFIPSMLEEDSFWKSQMIQLGFQYQITPDLAFGACGQTHISGVKVFKTHTIMGTITLAF